MATIEKAIEISAKAHAGVRDKQGKPYVLHPLRVMMGVTGDAAQIEISEEEYCRLMARFE